ncbi:MAG: hypothetical protein NTY35_17755 [Planctomycetota bacterium]|nr:hypothetical protein [Planctomycetota bacterium]
MASVKLLLAACAVAVSVTACKAPDQRIAPFANAWGAGDFTEAEKQIDALVADEAGVDPKLVTDSRGLDPAIEPAKGDTFLFLQEKSMARLAAGDTDGSIELLRRSRDVLASRYQGSDIAGWLAAGLTDDTVLQYNGADYEHVLTPAFLALFDLLEGGQDAYAYALQVGEVQETILGSTFGDDVDGKGNGYNPRKTYQRVPVGAYVEGLVREREGYSSEAFKAYERARDWGGASPICVEACERTSNGVYAPAGHGVVHVFRFAGRGPRLVQGTSPITDSALFLANIGSIVIGENVGTLGQMNVPVPVVMADTGSIPELEIREGGEVVGRTSTLLDVAGVAAQQVEANMPWILARAAIRRGAKAVAAKVVQDAVDKNNPNDSGFGLLAGIFTNLALTVGEKADTRNWTSLPARFQVARFALSEGTHDLDLSGGMRASVRVASGKDSYVVIVQPDIARPGAVLTDVYSRPAGSAP